LDSFVCFLTLLVLYKWGNGCCGQLKLTFQFINIVTFEIVNFFKKNIEINFLDFLF
jgi:hypothetical protein